MKVISNIRGSASTIIDILYADLKTLADTAALKPGQEYRITDFRTAYTIPNTAAFYAAPVEPLIVKAATATTLQAEARSEAYPQDVIYYELVVTRKWDNTLIDADRGWIYYREDTLQNNKLSYDFRSCKWRRWNTQEDGLGTWSVLTDNTFPFQDFYTFGNYAWVNGNDFSSIAWKSDSASYRENFNNVFHTNSKGNFSRGKFTDNTFLGETHHNDFGVGFNHNVLSLDFDYNRILDSFASNTVLCTFNNNTVGMDFTGFTFSPGLIIDSFIGGGGATSGSDHPSFKIWQDSLVPTPLDGSIEYITGGAEFYGTVWDGMAPSRKTFAFLESPLFTTPDIGAATATSVNKLTLTAPATSATLTIAGGKTFTSTNTITLAGTDGATLNIGAGGALGTAAFTDVVTPTQTDVTASRALDTTYTNSSVKSITVNATVRCAVTVASGTAYVQGKSDSATPPTTIASGVVGIEAGLGGEDNTFQISFVVAAGKTYRLDSTATNGTVTLGKWFEISH